MSDQALLERIKTAIAAHQPDDGHTQWYVDEFCIDCDAEEFWRVVQKALTSGEAALEQVSKTREEQAMTAIWVAYDAISGDVTDSGPEHEMKAMLARVDRETKGQHTVRICAEKDWRRNTEDIRRGMSGNPPRRHPR